METIIYFVFVILSLVVISFTLSWCVGCFLKRDFNKGVILHEESPVEFCGCYCCTWRCSSFNGGDVIYVADGHYLNYGSDMSDSVPTCNENVILSNDICPICLDAFTGKCEVVLLECNHGYHKTCILNWIKVHIDTYCPLCKTSIHSEYMTIF